MKTITALALCALFALGLPIAPASASSALLSVHESFGQVVDGPAPDTTVDGSVAVTNYQSSAAAAPHIRDGFLSTANPDAAYGGSYRIVKMDANVTRTGALFAFTPHSARGGVLCLSIQGTSIDTGKPVPTSPVHFVISPTGWNLDVNTEAGTEVDRLVSERFDTPLTSDGATLHRVEVVLDRAASRVSLTLPDGTVRTLTNPAFGMAGAFVYVEPFKSPAGGALADQTNALVSEWWADTEAVSIDEAGTEVEVSTEEPTTTPTTVVVEPSPTITPEPTSVAVEAPPATTVTEVQKTSKPRRVKALRRGHAVVVKWRAAPTVRVKCGTVSKVVDGKRAKVRAASSHCKVRAVGDSGASRWVKVRVR